ncbi:thioredoxin family protein [Sporosarcina sp. HYO08]|uniref:thioredoxin family protein n=1 Tax=Sporosarcina sp. HYO08 TaxID=1759557 RepID=UPI0007920390|nr:thioredoxin family protein [Sporosarcina sp. HYO08]KXH81706.1 thioredoxin [Sporosarcina sp. HYO08]
MNTIDSYAEWQDILQQENAFLLFMKMENCSVCDGLLPQVMELKKDFDLPFYVVRAEDVPEIAGQLQIFTAPVVLLFNEGKEYARFARFVQMEELKRRLSELAQLGAEH